MLVRSVRTILIGGRHAQTLPVPVGPVHLNSGASVDPRENRCVYICDVSINWPVSCCLFVSSLKRTPDT